MAEIDKKLIHFNQESTFKTRKEDIKNTSIAFIKDTQKIYTHGQIYEAVPEGGEEGQVLVRDKDGKLVWQNNTLIRNGENGPIITDIIVYDDGKDDDGMLTKSVADGLYQPIGEYATKEELEEAIEGVDLSDYYTKDEIDETVSDLEGSIDEKQPKFNVGTGLELEDGTLSVTLDTTIFKVVESLPAQPATGDANKLHLVLSTSSETGNLYEEYLYVNNKWELLGKFKAEVDLTPYLKIEDIAEEVADAGFVTFDDVATASKNGVLSKQLFTNLSRSVILNATFTSETDKVKFYLQQIAPGASSPQDSTQELPLSSGTSAGVMTAAQYTKLTAIPDPSTLATTDIFDWAEL